MSRSAELNLHLHPKQGEALNTEATETLYGGAAGGGKSHLMRVAAIIWCAMIAGLQVYLFRRIRDDLIKNHMEGPKGFRAMLAPWEAAGLVKIVDDEIRFWNGSKIYLCHCKDARDIYKYQGAEIHVLIIDELTHFTEEMYRFLRNRVRMVGVTLPAAFAGKFPRILCGANPGNVGHLFVKATFVDDVEPMTLRRMPPSEGGMLRQYIPARLEDNPSMAADDPGYEDRLEGLGSAQLVRAMRHGDWDVIEGAFFDCWDRSRHTVRPFEVPSHWARFWSGDWGSAKPFSFGLWSVVSDPHRTAEGVLLPRGALLRIKEWYGCQSGQPNTGLKLPAEKVGEGLADRSKSHDVRGCVLDPAAFASDGGPSIAERLRTGVKSAGGMLGFRPADNKRVAQRGAMGGWDQMRGRMIGDGDGNPMIACFSTCVDSIRTIPALQHDSSRPEDVNSEGEDHCFTGETCVRTPLGDVALQDLPQEGWLIGPDGLPARYRGPRVIGSVSPLVRVKYSDGSAVDCTSDHLFLTEDGWCEAGKLSGRSVLTPSPSSARRCKSSKAAGTGSAVGIFSVKAGGSTWWSTADAMVQSLSAIMSTTRTRTSRTTSPGTLRPSRQESTYPTIWRIALTRAARFWSALLDLPPLGGMGPRLALSGIGSTTPPSPGQRSTGRSARRASIVLNHSLAGKASEISSAPMPASRLGGERAARTMLTTLARSVAARFGAIATRSSKRALGSVGPSRVVCVGVEPLADQRPVWCLTVPEWGAFVLANGAIVKNCADEWRYACMSRPWTPPSRAPKPKPRDRWGDTESRGAADWKSA